MLSSTREGFGKAILKMATREPKLMVLSADLSQSLQLEDFKEKFPDQYVEIGVSEQNMIGVAAGLAMLGKTVVAASFAAFNPGRNWEQIRVSVCEQKLNVKIVGSHAGLATGADGATHQALEDLALMSVLPEMKVIVPCDEEEAAAATEAMIQIVGPAYLRLSRAKTELVNQGATVFEIGKGRVLTEGEDVTIIACGLMVPLAQQAAQELKKEADLKIGVVNMHTLKPLDTDLLARLANKTQVLVTVEEHQAIGGLGSLVASFLSQNCPKVLEIVAVSDQFGESGTHLELWEKYGLTVEAIKQKILLALERRIKKG